MTFRRTCGQLRGASHSSDRSTQSRQIGPDLWPQRTAHPWRLLDGIGVPTESEDNMVRVEIKSTEVAEHSGTDKAGRPFLIRKQHGYLDVGKAYPVEVAIRLDVGQEPFKPGFYVLGPRCFYVRQFGEVGCDLSKMEPARAPGLAGKVA